MSSKYENKKIITNSVLRAVYIVKRLLNKLDEITILLMVILNGLIKYYKNKNLSKTKLN